MNARDITLTLVAARGTDATVCPSEVARALAAGTGTMVAKGDWRSAMPAVHAAVDLLVAEGSVRLSWKGRVLDARIGPYRIGRAASERRIGSDDRTNETDNIGVIIRRMY